MDAQRDIYTVSRLNSEARAVLEGNFPLLWVSGELSNLVKARSGHLYFTLKDAAAQVRCALFRNRRLRMRYEPAEGEEVLARVRISFYEPRGEFQLLVEHLEPAGAGAAARAFEELKQRLHAEGLFDNARKRELPGFPTRVGVVTSPTGAAIRDVLQVLKRRAPQIRVLLYPSLVQGGDAPADLRAALSIALERADCDVLLITRGGGSSEDLAAFNDESLARLIAAAELPIVSAVGHEIDFSITDFVADRRAPTPSAAAELISPDGPALKQSLARLDGRMSAALSRLQANQRKQVANLEGRLRRAAPAARLQQQQQRLDTLDLRLTRAVLQSRQRRAVQVDAAMRGLAAHHPRAGLIAGRETCAALMSRLQRSWDGAQRHRVEQVAALGRQLHAVSPQATMRRGYAVIRRQEDQRLVASVDEVRHGTALQLHVTDGQIDVRVDQTHRDEQDR